MDHGKRNYRREKFIKLKICPKTKDFFPIEVNVDNNFIVINSDVKSEINNVVIKPVLPLICPVINPILIVEKEENIVIINRTKNLINEEYEYQQTFR